MDVEWIQVLSIDRVNYLRTQLFTHRALVRFLPRVAAHVNHQHVLSFEGLLLPRTLVPAAHELLLLSMDVVVIDVLGDTAAQMSFSKEALPLRGSRKDFHGNPSSREAAQLIRTSWNLRTTRMNVRFKGNLQIMRLSVKIKR